MWRIPALAYPSVDGTKKEDFLIEAILVATYNGTCIQQAFDIRPPH